MATAMMARRRRSRALLFYMSVVVILHLLHSHFLLPISATTLFTAADSNTHLHLQLQSNDNSHHLILTKIYCLIIVFFATFFAGISPCFCTWNPSFLVLGTQFSGGVFMATALLHFLGDADETFSNLVTQSDYPFALLLACAGYLLAMLADCIVHCLFGAVHHKLAMGSDVESAANCSSNIVSTQGQCSCANRSELLQHSQLDYDSNNNAIVMGSLVRGTSFTDAILLILALCFHSVFEGIAIGVAGNPDDAWKALWTISLHKVFAAIAMGIALLRMMPSRPQLQCALYAFAFAISSPLGVAIGIIIDSTTEGHVADWIYAIAMGVACGIFLYVAINHLFATKGYIPQGRVMVDTPFYKLLAITLGVAVIAVVMIWDY